MFEMPGVVLSVDNSQLLQAGIANIGVQFTRVMLTNGEHKGGIVTADNHMMGQLDLDEIYHPGDTILLAVQVIDHEITNAKAINKYRQNWELILFAVFAVVLVLYSRIVGIKALLSFVASLLILWYVYLPNLLAGKEPLLLSLVVLILLAMVIIFSVAGFSRKGLAAFIGTISGLVVTLALTLFFGSKLGLMGMTTPFSTTLIMSGHFDLNMQHIFYSAVLLGASGAAMDIAMDVSASMGEIKIKRPDISTRELIQSGYTIGRMVIGTMATTLLLAYSGGYLTMLMVFVSQGTSATRIVNMKIVAAEIFRVLIGSIGLLMVAPVTAVVAGLLLGLSVDRLSWNRLFRRSGLSGKEEKNLLLSCQEAVDGGENSLLSCQGAVDGKQPVRELPEIGDDVVAELSVEDIESGKG